MYSLILLTRGATDFGRLWLLDCVSDYLAADWTLKVSSCHGRSCVRWVTYHTPPLLLHTLKDLIQNITCRKMRDFIWKCSHGNRWLRSTNSCPPELGQRRLKSSLVRRHKALPFISNRPFSGRRSEYSFWAQWSHRETSSLSHRDGLIPGNNKCIISNLMCLQKVLHMCICSHICN